MLLVRALVCALLLVSTATATEKLRFNAATAQIQLPLMFEVNRGQTDARVRYLARGPGYNLFLTDGEAVLRLSNGEKGSVLRLRPVNAASAQVIGEQPLSGRANYLSSSNPQEWITDVPLFESVRYANMLPGIDLLYYGKQGRLEYDFVVAPGSDPRSIAVEIAGAETLRLAANGDLLIRTSEFSLRWKKPFAYQQSGATRKEVPAGYVLAGNRVSFKLGHYDRTRELVIDPALVYSTYLGGATTFDPFNEGGSAFSSIAGIDVDGGNDAYVFGITDAGDFPTTAGAFDRFADGNCNPHGGNCTTMFVTKLNPSGTALVYSTFFGTGFPADIAVDGNGRAYLTGNTNAGVPTTSNAYQPRRTQCGEFDCPLVAFLSVLNAAGNGLVYSTYFHDDPEAFDDRPQANAVAVGTSGVAYITGSAGPEGLPVTPNAYQATNAGNTDAFVAKINPARSGVLSLEYSSYFGSSGRESGEDIATEGGRVYFTGSTNSADFPTTAGAFDRTRSGGSDAFVAKLDTNQAGAASLVFSTLLGGSSFDSGASIALKGRNPYILGSTTSTDFPTTTGAFDRTRAPECKSEHDEECGDLFVTVLSESGSALQASTYFGGSLDESAAGIDVDSEGRIHFAGTTVSPDLPTTSDAFQRNYRATTCSAGEFTFRCTDTFLTMMNASASALLYSTYFGGSKDDDAFAAALGPNRNFYIAGRTDSTDLPTTSGAFQRTRKSTGAGTVDGFVAKFNMAGGCAPGSTDRTVRICQPQDGATVSSPVHVSAAANPGASAILRMNVWVDGEKKFERQDTTVIETDIPMTEGSHRLTVQAADSAGTFKSTVFITVGAGGGTCPPPSTNRTINICEPADGATVSSPVRIRATAHSTSGVKFSQIYVDGQRRVHATGATLNTSIAMAAGTRRITVQCEDNADVVFKKTIFVTVR